MMRVTSSGISNEEGAMCWRSAAEYDLYARTGSKPVRTVSKPGRSLVDVLRDLFRPRRRQLAEVVPFPVGGAAAGAKATDRKGHRAA
jgi:hypothetical protein